MRRIGTLAAVLAAALSTGAGHASAAHANGRPARVTEEATGSVTGFSVVPGDGQAEVVIALTGPVKVADFVIQGPDRIVLDLTDARLTPLGRAYDRKPRGGIRNVRVAQYNPQIVRVVLELDTKRAYKVSQSNSEIRVAVTGGETFVAFHSKGQQATVASAPAAAASAPAPAPAKPSTPNVATGSVDTTPAKPAAAAPPPAASAAAPVTAPVVTPPPAAERPVNEIDAALARAEVPPARMGRQGSQQRRITITWEDAPIADVLATFAEIGGRTIVRGKAVSGTISAEIKDQPWDIAMKAILDAHGLAATEENSGIIVVDSYENILARQASEPLRTEMVRINYVSAGSLVETVGGLLSRDCAPAGAASSAPGGSQSAGQPYCITRGNIVADSGTNSLIITEVSSRLNGLLQYIGQLDVRTPQVQLKAKIISGPHRRLLSGLSSNSIGAIA